MNKESEPLKAGDYLEYYQAGISLLAFVRKAAGSIKAALKHYSATGVVTVDRAVEDYFNQITGPGSIITVEGFLSRYILTERVNFDSERFARSQGGTVKNNILNPFVDDVEIKIMFEAGQYPVQAIPPIPDGKGVVCLYMLYPPDTNSFLLEPGSDDKLSRIGRRQKPIVVVSDEEFLSGLNSVVRLTGVIKQLSGSAESLFYGRLGSANKKIVDRFFNPYREEVNSLCIDLRGGEARLSVLNEKKGVPGVIYLESHFEGVHGLPVYQKLIGESLPGAYPGLHWNTLDGISWGLSESSVAIGTKDYVNYCYQVETDLCGGERYARDVRALNEFLQKFRKAVQNRARREFGVEIKHGIDFVFDNRKARLFHPDGVFSAKEYSEASSSDEVIRETGDWLKSRT